MPQTRKLIEAIVGAFEQAASGSIVPEFDSYLPATGDPHRATIVRELARVDLELRWARGERPSLDRYVERYSELREPSAMADLAFEEYRQRAHAGDLPSRDEYRSRYGVDVSQWPAAADTKRSNPSTGRHTWRPKPADDMPRTMAVEVPANDINEYRSAAPVDAERIDRAQRDMPSVGDTFLGFRLVRVLGTGAFGRVFFAEQIDLAGRKMALKVTADLGGEVQALARLQHTNIVPIYSAHRTAGLQAICMPYFGSTTLADALPTARRPESLDSVLRIGERLADALAHAHERGIVHRDIKPANVLIADDGQPMLLDFNLATNDQAGAAEKARVGGTLPYMAPEQLRAFVGGPIRVDERADIYSLGVVLYQLLAGRLPFARPPGPIRGAIATMIAEREVGPPSFESGVLATPAVESIVRKCLAADLDKRYASAADLRDDLARQRTNQPLKHAAEPSYRERMKKWTRRHPKLTSPAALIAYAAALVLFGVAGSVQLSLSARAARQDRERVAAQHRLDEFLALSDRVKQVAGSPSDSAEVLRLGSDALARYGADRPNWEEEPGVANLPAADRAKLKGEIGEIAFLAARAAALSRRQGELADRLNALAATTLVDDSAVAVKAQRSELDGADGPEIDGKGERADFLRACDLAARGRHRDALPMVIRFVTKHPDDFGGWYLSARCHDTLGQYEEARAGYATCAALRPSFAHTYAARGALAFRQDKDLEQARADLDRALELEPNLVEARLNRALVLRTIGRFADAKNDLDQVASRDDAPTRVYFFRAMVHDNLGNKSGAAADRTEGMKRSPTDPASFVMRGLTRADAEPAAALADFQAAEKLDPNYPEAMVNQSWILGEKLNRSEDALRAVDRLLALYPDHLNGRGGRAVLLARLGRADEAIAEAKKCLAAAPTPLSQYQAGCVYAVVSKVDAKHRAEGLRLVASALMRGFGYEYVLTDVDLDPLRRDARFQRLTDAVKSLTDLSHPPASTATNKP